MSRPDAVALTYPLRTAARLTGLSPELLRAWERRYGVVEPMRTPGGTRRYSADDLERLRHVKAAVDAGHRISTVANLSLEELRACAAPPARDDPHGTSRTERLAEVIDALEALDGGAAQRLLGFQLSALGPTVFAHEVARPLVEEIGERWAGGRLGIASEHLATAVLRSLLGASMQPAASHQSGPRIVFATPPDERHELGLLMAALTALGSGANPLYLGAELPIEDLLEAAERANADVMALSIVSLPCAQAERTTRALRAGLPDSVDLWIGGSRARDLDALGGVLYLHDLAAIEQQVSFVAARSA